MLLVFCAASAAAWLGQMDYGVEGYGPDRSFLFPENWDSPGEVCGRTGRIHRQLGKLLWVRALSLFFCCFIAGKGRQEINICFIVFILHLLVLF